MKLKRWGLMAVAAIVGYVLGVAVAKPLFGNSYANENFGWAIVGMMVTGPIGAVVGFRFASALSRSSKAAEAVEGSSNERA